MSHSELSDTDTLRDWKWHLICILLALELKCSRADAANPITEMEEGCWKRLIHLLGFSKKRWLSLFHHPSSIFLISPKIHMPGGQTGEANEIAKVRIPTGILGTHFRTWLYCSSYRDSSMCLTLWDGHITWWDKMCATKLINCARKDCWDGLTSWLQKS